MSMNKLEPLIQQQVTLIIQVCAGYGSESSVQISFGTYTSRGGRHLLPCVDMGTGPEITHGSAVEQGV